MMRDGPFVASNAFLGGNRILDNFIVGETGSREGGTRRWGCCAFRRVRIGLSPLSPPSPTTKAGHNSGPRIHRVALLGFALAALHSRLLTRGTIALHDYPLRHNLQQQQAAVFLIGHEGSSSRSSCRYYYCNTFLCALF
jgi:hypothetical protein